MLMLRKTFSSSFASSAASGDDSSTTWSLMLRSSAAARVVACGVVAPTRRGTPLRGAGRIAGVHPLGGEGQVEVDAGLQPAPLDDLGERSGRRPGERRRLEHDQLAGADVPADRLGGGQDRREVRVLGRGDRRRDAHEDRVRLGHRRVDRRDDTHAAIQRGTEPLVGDVIDRGGPRQELGDAAGQGVDAFDLESGLREGDGQRQADVAEADDGHATVLSHGSSRNGSSSGRGTRRVGDARLTGTADGVLFPEG